jgi:uncharacterized protein (DUF4415 family)
MDFEWDEAKNRANIAKHGIGFLGAARIFDGPVLEWADRRRDYGETKRSAIGELEGKRFASSIPCAAIRAGLSQPGERTDVKEENIVRYSRDSLPKDDQTDWARVLAMTEEELDAAARSDPDAQPTTEEDWAEAVVILPGPKQLVCLRIDRDILDWFRGQGRGYQTRMNAVLRAYMAAQTKVAPSKRKSR